MQNVKTPTSRSYHEFLIETLKNPEEVAGYIEVTLEEGGDEPILLPKVLRNVVEAYAKMNKLPESAQLKYENLDKLLTESGCSEIYSFVEFLDALGFRLAVTLKEGEFITEEAPVATTTRAEQRRADDKAVSQAFQERADALTNAAAAGLEAIEASEEEVAT